VRSGEKRRRRRRLPPAPGTFGAPSAWVFLIGCTPAEPTPLPQAIKFSTQPREGSQRNKWNDGNVASRTGPGGRNMNGWAARPPRVRRVVPVPGFDGSPVGEYRLGCFGLLPVWGETCADTYRSPSPASHARPRAGASAARIHEAASPEAWQLVVSRSGENDFGSAKGEESCPSMEVRFGGMHSGDQREGIKASEPSRSVGVRSAP
jgi:hypothetical protein